MFSVDKIANTSQRCVAAANTGTVTAQFTYYGYGNWKKPHQTNNRKPTKIDIHGTESVLPLTREIESSVRVITVKDRIRQGTEAPLTGICVLRWYLMASVWIFSCSVVPYSVSCPLYNTNCSDSFLWGFSIRITWQNCGSPQCEFLERMCVKGKVNILPCNC